MTVRHSDRSRLLTMAVSPHILGLSGILLILFLQQALFYDFFIDDSYISIVYVKNWLHGNGLTYNGLVVEGFSNFLWVIFLCVIGLSGIDIILASKWLGILCAAGTLIVVVVLGLRLTNRWREGIMAGLLLALCGPFVAWSVGGLEAYLFALLLMLLVLDLLREQTLPSISWPRSAVWAVLLALTRPEGIGLAAVAWVWLVAMQLLNRDRMRLRTLIRWTLLVALGFGLFLLWRYLRYNDILPSTVYAKRSTLVDQLYAARMRLLPLVGAWSLWLGGFVLGSVACLVLLPQQPRALLLILMLFGAYLGFVILSGADWMPMHRFVVPLLPLAALITTCGISFLVQRLLPGRWRSMELVVFGCLLLPIYLQLGFWTERNRVDAITTGRSSFLPNIDLGNRIKESYSHVNGIAAVDAGALAYYAEVPVLDLYGLNNHYIARLPGKFGERFDPNYVLDYQPAFIETHYEMTKSGVPRFIQFEVLYHLYYTREFQRWYVRDETLPMGPFRRLEQPLAHTMMDRFYAAEIILEQPIKTLIAAKPQKVRVRVFNNGTGIWRSAKKLELGAVYVRSRILKKETQQVVAEQWTPLAKDLSPNEGDIIEANIIPPREVGTYQLQADLVLNGVSYFVEENGALLKVDFENQRS